ncbi:hypothetical protein VMT65_26590 [Nocardia sp. CDC153]|uniref:hypothetical protein n=1 Tax=Nocardia sp. CDC153 TaxID=3112167 RepID=UPI002DB9302F|nr:hypothetical protein [Nocardia sp. CDC153]MEC3956631.1 hypothetical protein [Nocardia sp. CDC153]
MSGERIPVDPTDSEGRSDVREPNPGNPSEFDVRAEAAADAGAQDLHTEGGAWGMADE